MAARYPEPDSEAALEGERAHEVAKLVVDGKPAPPWATEEMLDGADLWAEVWQHLEPALEVKVHYSEHNWGTCDGWAWEDPTHTLVVGDYKFGHRAVDVVDNWQLLDYAMCIMKEYNLKPSSLRLIICQPRCYHRDTPIRVCTMPTVDLQRSFEVLQQAIEQAMRPDAPTVTGPECLFCPARNHCHTYHESSTAVLQMVGDNVPFDMPIEQQSRYLRLIREAQTILQGRATAIENELLGRIRLGQSIPGWSMEQSYGREEWQAPLAQVLALGELCGVDISKREAITPKQAIKAGIPAEMVKALSIVKSGKLKIVPDDGSRARQAFGGK